MKCRKKWIRSVQLHHQYHLRCDIILLLFFSLRTNFTSIFDLLLISKVLDRTDFQIQAFVKNCVPFSIHLHKTVAVHFAYVLEHVHGFGRLYMNTAKQNKFCVWYTKMGFIKKKYKTNVNKRKLKIWHISNVALILLKTISEICI